MIRASSLAYKMSCRAVLTPPQLVSIQGHYLGRGQDFMYTSGRYMLHRSTFSVCCGFEHSCARGTLDWLCVYIISICWLYLIDFAQFWYTLHSYMVFGAAYSINVRVYRLQLPSSHQCGQFQCRGKKQHAAFFFSAQNCTGTQQNHTGMHLSALKISTCGTTCLGFA